MIAYKRLSYQVVIYRSPREALKWISLFITFSVALIAGCGTVPDIPDKEPMPSAKRSHAKNQLTKKSLDEGMMLAIEKASTMAKSSGKKEEDPWKSPLEFRNPTEALESSVATSSIISARDKDYVLGPEDVISVTVWNHKDLSRKLKISREGEISFPLIGKIRATGLTAVQLEKEIAHLLADGYLLNPQVSVYIDQYRSNKVFVLGEVGGPAGKGTKVGPGIYPLTGKTYLLEIISRAGGPTIDAGNVIMVIRPRNRRVTNEPIPLNQAEEGEVIKINLKALQDGDMTQNIELQNGDTIYIPEAKYLFVFGEVKKPGRFKLEEGTTVLKAITMARGLTPKAAVNRTKILREKDGVRIVIKARMNDLIQPEDIVMVPESFF